VAALASSSHPREAESLPTVSGAPRIVTLVFTDLEKSTNLVTRLGDERSSAILAEHDAAARATLARFNGREIDKSDGFLLLFDRPLDAVWFGLEFHRALRDVSARLGQGLKTRVAIHLGEVRLVETPAEAIARGAKPVEVTGLAKNIAARLMDLALPGQTLMTRAAFDLARRGAVGDDALPAGLAWKAHGAYAFKGIDHEQEVCEVGTPGVDPLVAPASSAKAQRIVEAGEEETLDWRPNVGGEVKRRPGWVLERMLGAGGFGEVWLARHTGTGERRVFKFCFSFRLLRNLKREFTLFRLLRQTLGQRPDIQRLHDVNFDEAPYFLELEYAPGGNLAEWLERQGRAGAPLSLQLELMAQSAEAVQAAHALGILHKDIKPQNILVDDTGAAPRVRLTDFGLGELLDEKTLESHNITSVGLTALEEDNGGGTRAYMSPERLQGAPATVASDVYALGVMLFQLVVGDLQAPLTADSLERIDDKLLRGDIAACVATDPTKRLTTAGELATRLRTLEARRARARLDSFVRIASIVGAMAVVILVAAFIGAERDMREADEKKRLDETIALVEDAAARRLIQVQANAALAQERLAAGHRLVVGLITEFSRLIDRSVSRQNELAQWIRREVTAYATVDDVSSWPNDLVLSQAAQTLELARPFRQLGFLDDAMALTTASAAMAERIATKDRSLAEQRDELRDRAEEFYVLLLAPSNPAEAHRLREERVARDRAAGRVRPTELLNLVVARQRVGDLDGAESLFNETRAILDADAHLYASELASSERVLAGLLLQRGRWADASDAIQTVIDRSIAQGSDPSSPTVLDWKANRAVTLQHSGRLKEAENLAREVVDAWTKLTGPDEAKTLNARVNLASILVDSERAVDAEQDLRAVLSVLGDRAALDSFHAYNAWGILAEALFVQGKYAEALPYATQAVDAQRDVREQARNRAIVGVIQLKLGDRSAARASLTESLGTLERLYGAEHVYAVRARAALKDALSD